MSSEKFIVEPPKIVERHVKKTLFCGPGPANMWPSVDEALTRNLICNMCDNFFNVMDDIRAGIQYLFQTKSKLVLAISGAGHAGMEAVIINLVAPGETLLIASRGQWDLRADIVARRYGIKTVVKQIPFNEVFSTNQVESMLKEVRPKAMFITHGDSSTGSVQKNLNELGQLCRKYGALFIVDTVVSIAGEPFFMDEWKVDAVYTAAQKAMSGPAGIAPVAFSARAEETIKNRKHEPPFYFDIKELALQWNCYSSTRKYHHTVSTPMMWALRCCLIEIANETLAKSWARHDAVMKHFHKLLGKLPLKFHIEPEYRLNTVTTVAPPAGYDYMECIQYMRDNHNILIFGGVGPTVGKTFRIGLMGVNATFENADRVAAALADTLKALGKRSHL